MAVFPLRVICPDGVKFEGHVQQLTVRTASGEMGILAHHANIAAPLGKGRATVIADGIPRHAACMGGIVSIMNGAVTMLPTTFEWTDEMEHGRMSSEK